MSPAWKAREQEKRDIILCDCGADPQNIRNGVHGIKCSIFPTDVYKKEPEMKKLYQLVDFFTGTRWHPLAVWLENKFHKLSK